MVRTFDQVDGVIVYGHIVVELGQKDRASSFTIGVMCNDDVRARAFLNSFLDIPPAFHRRSEVRVVEKRWRKDPVAVMRYMANVHSALGQVMGVTPSDKQKTYTLSFKPPPDMMKQLTGMGAWWT